MNADMVMMTAKCLEAREAAQFLLGDAYATQIQPFAAVIRQEATRKGISHLSAAIRLMVKVEDAHIQLFLLAAAIDLVEGKDVTT